MDPIKTGKPELDKKITEYLEYAQDLDTARDVKQLVDRRDFDTLEKMMMKRLSFGTAGLRGPMGPGYAAMNDLVIIQTSQGVAKYVNTIAKDFSGKSVVIGFDNRYNSERFAQLAAVSFLLKDFKVYLYSKMIPTPFIPYTVRYLNCCVGIMITASHNPKEDNGYKVYWDNGAQILPPHDKNIQDTIMEQLKPWPGALDVSLVWTSSNCLDPLFNVPLSYFQELETNCHSFENSPNLGYENLKITFTAMHGVSHVYIKEAFNKLHFKSYVPVQEQMRPDPSFPTVVFPNPEEKNCLDLSIKTAEENGSRLILANDPDADRLAVAEKIYDGSWHVYSGNEVGALLGFWLWETLDVKWKATPANCHMVSSTVSSKILRSMSEVEGFHFEETLTGFKWMANKAYEVLKEKKKFVFAFEEAIGYMCGTMVLDKDGIQAAMQITKMAAFAYSSWKLLYDLLKEIYLKYGYHVSCNSYFICNNPDDIDSMFCRIRNYDFTSKYPEFLPGDRPYKITRIRDLTTGYDSAQPDKKAILPQTPNSQMITFYLDNGCEVTLRTSGTEPKVKYYTEMIAKVPEQEWPDVRRELNEIVQRVIKYWIEPEDHHFLPRQA